MATAPPQHRPRPSRPRDKRQGARQRGYNRRWDKYRAWFLAQPEHALCVECQRQGRLTEATVVDHVKPHKGDYDLFWDESNHQPLCKGCHCKKTAKESGFGRA